MTTLKASQVTPLMIRASGESQMSGNPVNDIKRLVAFVKMEFELRYSGTPFSTRGVRINVVEMEGTEDELQQIDFVPKNITWDNVSKTVRCKVGGRSYIIDMEEYFEMFSYFPEITMKWIQWEF